MLRHRTYDAYDFRVNFLS